MNFFRNQQGMSIASAMMAVAVVSGMGLYLMRSGGHILKMDAREKLDLEENELSDEIRLILGNKSSCGLTLNGMSFRKSQIHQPGSQAGLPLTIWTANSAGTARANQHVTQDMRRGGMKITSVRFFMDKGSSGNFPAGQGMEMGTIRVSYDHVSPDATLIKKNLNFPISVAHTTSSGGISTITGCNLAATSATCQALSMEYDPLKGNCANPEVCDDWVNMANADEWSGNKEHVCSTNPGGYIKSVRLSQERVEGGDKDFNGLQVRCCYQKTFQNMRTTGWNTLANPDLWSGNRSGYCTTESGGVVSSISLTQERDNGGDKDMNGLKIRCSYPDL